MKQEMKYQIALQIPSIYISLTQELSTIKPNYVVYTEEFRVVVGILQKARLSDGQVTPTTVRDSPRGFRVG
jgi:hypothetical protein